MEKRAAGVLCHISSLSGKYGIGSLGKEARLFAKNLAKSGVRYWQILPLVQTGYGDSPYQSVCCDSGNPYFIDLRQLKHEGLLTAKELKAAESRGESVDYGKLYEERYATLRTAFSRFFLDGKEFHDFVKSGRFEDYALYMTAKTVYGGSFTDWAKPIKYREEAAIEALRTDYHEEYLFWQFLQFEFWKQWKELKKYCNGLGLYIIGDIPLYVAADSSDVWAYPQLFKLDKQLKPVKVAGVPPDYFSQTGQLWGNPIYEWSAHEKENYAWWKRRLAVALDTYDVVRIDHFRGLDRFYEIPAGDKDATGGEWQEGPKEKLFENCFGKIIAEDLGLMDEGVYRLLDKTGFPGMKVLQFAFDGNADNEYLPKNFGENCICYTGTHDNNTTAGYIKELSAEEFILFCSRLAAELEAAEVPAKLDESEKSVCAAMVALAMASKARLAVIPIQDVLGLEYGRMNSPGTERDNWQFRLKKVPSAAALKQLKKLITVYKR